MNFFQHCNFWYLRYGLLQFGQASLREHEMATSMLWQKDLRDRWDEVSVLKNQSLSLKWEDLEGKMLLMDFLMGVEMMFHLLAFWMLCLLMNDWDSCLDALFADEWLRQLLTFGTTNIEGFIGQGSELIKSAKRWGHWNQRP